MEDYYETDTPTVAAQQSLPSDDEVGRVVSEWQKAMEGVTPGPWAVDGYSTDAVIFMPVGKSHVCDWKHLAKCGTADGHWRSNAAWIACCSPDSISNLLALLQSQAAKLAEERRARERAEAALAEMQPHIDKIEGCIQINNEMGRVVFGQTEAAQALAEIARRAHSKDGGDNG